MHLVRECENQRGRRKEEEIDEGRQMGGLIKYCDANTGNACTK